MTKKLALVMALASILTLTSCSKRIVLIDTKNITEDTTEIAEETTEEEAEEELTATAFNMGDLINEMSGGRPVVTINGDDGEVCSFDFSEMGTQKVEVSLSKPVEKGYMYVTMAGNVTDHTLESDGSMFDGIAEIVDGKASFSVEYDDEKRIEFVINVPMG